MTTTLTQQPRKIIIKQCPFNSQLASTLVAALDDELESMYPDWESLPHPGFQQDWVGGDTDTTTTTTATKRTDTGNPQPVLDALDSNNLPSTNSSTDSKKEFAHWETLTEEDAKKMVFHVAFDVTDTDTPPSSVSTLSTTDSSQGMPVGCIGLKAMPHFPHHRAQPSTSTSISHDTGLRHHYAELKRLYIAPSYRSIAISLSPASVSTSTSPVTSTRLSEALIEAAVTYSRETMGVDVLVLETGNRQHAAVRLYERLGWRRREDYGDYVGAGVGVGGVSLCYEREV